MSHIWMKTYESYRNLKTILIYLLIVNLTLRFNKFSLWAVPESDSKVKYNVEVKTLIPLLQRSPCINFYYNLIRMYSPHQHSLRFEPALLIIIYTIFNLLDCSHVNVSDAASIFYVSPDERKNPCRIPSHNCVITKEHTRLPLQALLFPTLYGYTLQLQRWQS